MKNIGALLYLAFVVAVLVGVLFNHAQGQPIYGWLVIQLGRAARWAANTLHSRGYNEPVCLPGFGAAAPGVLGGASPLCVKAEQLGCVLESMGRQLADRIARQRCPGAPTFMVNAPALGATMAPWELTLYALNWRWAWNGVMAIIVALIPQAETLLEMAWKGQPIVAWKSGLCAARYWDSVIVLACYVALAQMAFKRRGKSMQSVVGRVFRHLKNKLVR